jgi:putative SOS response-associated peptidase YedK
MLQPTDAVELRIYPVNRYVNDVRRDGPELIEPLSVPAIEATVPAESTLGL